MSSTSSEVTLNTAKALPNGTWLAGCIQKKVEYEVKRGVGDQDPTVTQMCVELTQCLRSPDPCLPLTGAISYVCSYKTLRLVCKG